MHQEIQLKKLNQILKFLFINLIVNLKNFNKINLDKLLLTLLTISCLLILLIFFIRFENSISFTNLTHVLTSGYEVHNSPFGNLVQD